MLHHSIPCLESIYRKRVFLRPIRNRRKKNFYLLGTPMQKKRSLSFSLQSIPEDLYPVFLQNDLSSFSSFSVRSVLKIHTLGALYLLSQFFLFTSLPFHDNIFVTEEGLDTASASIATTSHYLIFLCIVRKRMGRKWTKQDNPEIYCPLKS